MINGLRARALAALLLTSEHDFPNFPGIRDDLGRSPPMHRHLVALSCLILASTPAAAGVLDHPELLDADSWFASENPNSMSFNRVFIHHGEVQLSTAHGAFGDSNGTTWINVLWEIYEPDSIKRSHKRGRKSQAHWVQFGIATGTGYIANFTTFAELENCRASTKTSGVGPDDPETAKWKAGCNGVIEALGLSQPRIDLLETLLGKNVNVDKDKISVRGKGPYEPN